MARLDPRPVSKTVGGVTFQDPFAWLQADTEEVLAWQWRESRAAESALRSLPAFDALTRECAEEMQSVSPNIAIKRNGRWFTFRQSADALGHELIWSPTYDGAPVVFCKPQALGGTLERPAYVYKCTPSPDGRWAVVTVLPGGELNSKTFVVRVEDGHVVDAQLDVMVFLGFAEPSWTPDSSRFVVGDRAPDGHHRVRVVSISEVGCNVKDKDFDLTEVTPDIPVLTHHVSPDGSLSVAISAPHERSVTLLGNLASDVWRPFLPEGFRGECHGDWLDQSTYVAIVTDRSTRGELVAIPAATSQQRSTWRTLVAAGSSVLRNAIVRGGRIILTELVDVSFVLRVLSRDGQPLWTAPLPRFGSSSMTFPPRISSISDDLIVQFTTFDSRQALYTLDAQNLRLDVVMASSKTIDGLLVDQFFATSADGTRVPYFVVRRNDLPPGPQPAMLRAYGGFNLALTPNYLGEVAPFVRCGGVFIQANLRGGGEYGGAWHDAGRLRNKQNCFADCYAVAEDAISRGLTTPDRLVLQGASNGGLLAAVAAVQRPDLFAATIPFSPLLDMMEPVRPGAAEDAERVRAVFVGDYGDPNDPGDAAVLYSYSPYHNIREGVSYPAILQILGENDLACPPYHGRKFTARLRNASTSGKPILLRVWPRGGHGGSSDPAAFAHTFSEMMAFVFQHSGLKYVPTDRPNPSG